METRYFYVTVFCIFLVFSCCVHPSEELTETFRSHVAPSLEIIIKNIDVDNGHWQEPGYINEEYNFDSKNQIQRCFIKADKMLLTSLIKHDVSKIDGTLKKIQELLNSSPNKDQLILLGRTYQDSPAVIEIYQKILDDFPLFLDLKGWKYYIQSLKIQNDVILFAKGVNFVDSVNQRGDFIKLVGTVGKLTSFVISLPELTDDFSLMLSELNQCLSSETN